MDTLWTPEWTPLWTPEWTGQRGKNEKNSFVKEKYLTGERGSVRIGEVIVK